LLRPETTGDNEGELGGGEMIASSEGTVIQWASPRLASLPGHDASLDEHRRDGCGWVQRKKVVEDPEKVEEQTGKMPRRNERTVWCPNLHRTLRVDVGGSHEGRGDCKPGAGTPNLVRAWLP
jgi:hypothetical protein